MHAKLCRTFRKSRVGSQAVAIRVGRSYGKRRDPVVHFREEG
jgi:hypothetical protein